MNENEILKKSIEINYLGEGLEDSASIYNDLKDSPEKLEIWTEVVSIREKYKELPEHYPTYTSVYNIMKEAKAFHEEARVGEFVSFKERIFSLLARFNIAPIAISACLLLATISVFDIGSITGSQDLAQMEAPEKLAGQLLNEDEPFNEPKNHFHFEQQKPLMAAKTNVSPFGFRTVAIEDADDLGDSRGLFPQESPKSIEDEFTARKKAMMESDADALLMRGRRYKAKGRIDLALRDFETIYRYYPGYTYMGDVLMYRAQCLAFQGKYDQAVESLEIFAKKYPAKKNLVLPMIHQIEASRESSVQ